MSLHRNNPNLTPEVRRHMRAEIEADQRAGRLYQSGRLTPDGLARWFGLLCEAADAHDDAWLERALGAGLVAASSSDGRRVPSDAAQTLAECEFNLYFTRAFCLRVLEAGHTHVEVYRARPSANPRPESVRLQGQNLDAQELLEDLRRPLAQRTSPLPQPNSGLSVRPALPKPR